MRGKRVLVTGGSSGIGWQIARGLARQGARVLLAARDRKRGRAAARSIRDEIPGARASWLPLDLASFDSVRACADSVAERGGRLDVLVNNAATVSARRLETPDGFERIFAVNYLGHFLLTGLLLDLLTAAGRARVVNITSTLHWFVPTGLDFDDLQSQEDYDGLLAYAGSKLALIQFTRELAQRLDPEKITVNAICPGMVDTRYAGAEGAPGVIGLAAALARPISLSPEVGARAPVRLASSPLFDGVSGRYYVMGIPALPSFAATDPAAGRRLWEISESLVEAAEQRARCPSAS